jgi:HPt (histidine-containing phosphotransfer) domain-containing protein
MDYTNNLYDLSTLQDMLEGDEEALNMMLKKFVEVSPGLLKDINTSFKNNDLEKVRKIAHEIKPTIDILNINELKTDIRKIEKGSLDQDKIEELRQLITRLNEIYTVVLNDIGKLIC